MSDIILPHSYNPFVDGPQEVSRIKCLSCGYEDIVVRPKDMPLKYLPCPNCHSQGTVIQIGDFI